MMAAKRTQYLILEKALKPLFGACLLLSQFLSGRTTYLSSSAWLLAAGGVLTAGGLVLLILASLRLKQASRGQSIADGGPYRYIRHPIYVAIYILSTGLGLIFFSWIWFLVMAVFLPAWYVVCREEEKELLAVYGEYMSKTRMFLPGLL